jgi:hypothetical protein
MRRNTGGTAMVCVKDSILREFSRNPGGQPCLCFSDPAYVRSDLIILNRKDLSVHAVLQGMTHFVGYADEAMMQDVEDGNEIILSAQHYHSGTVHLPSKITVI